MSTLADVAPVDLSDSRTSERLTISLEPSPTASARARTIPPKRIPKARFTMPLAICKCSSAIAMVRTITIHLIPTLSNRAY